MTILDYPKFEQELYKAACAELEVIKSECGNEHLYSFALSTTGLFGYVFPNANTEEGILRAAKEHIVEARGFRGNMDMAIISARWEPSLYWRFFRQQNPRFRRRKNASSVPRLGRTPTIRYIVNKFTQSRIAIYARASQTTIGRRILVSIGLLFIE